MIKYVLLLAALLNYCDFKRPGKCLYFHACCDTGVWSGVQSRQRSSLSSWIDQWHLIGLCGGTMSAAEWKQRCEAEWSLQGATMPDSVDWKSVYEAKPLGRNLLKNPSPHGTITLTHTIFLSCFPALYWSRDRFNSPRSIARQGSPAGSAFSADTDEGPAH